MAVELGAGYVTLTVRYAEGMKKAAAGITKEAEKAGEKAGKQLQHNLNKTITKSKPVEVRTTYKPPKHEELQKQYDKEAKRVRKTKAGIEIPIKPKVSAPDVKELQRRYLEQIRKGGGLFSGPRGGGKWGGVKIPVDIATRPEALEEFERELKKKQQGTKVEVPVAPKVDPARAKDLQRQMLEQIRKGGGLFTGPRGGGKWGGVVIPADIATRPEALEEFEREVEKVQQRNADSAKQKNKEVAQDQIKTTEDAMREGAQKGNTHIEKAAKETGKKIGDAISKSPAGDTLRDWNEKAQKANTAIDKMGTSFDAIKTKDPGAALKNASEALKTIGLTGAAEYLDRFQGHADKATTTIERLPGIIADIKTGEPDKIFDAMSRGLEGIGQSGAADQISEVGRRVGDTKQQVDDLSGTLKDVLPAASKDGTKSMTDDLLGLVETFGKVTVAAEAFLQTTRMINPDFLKTQESKLGFSALSPMGPVAATTPQIVPNIMQKEYNWLAGKVPGLPQWKGRLPFGGGARRAAGGVVRGPGSGTSDSILVRLSDGEGVVNAKAMAAGGAAIVDALNKGALPGYQRGGVVQQAIAFGQKESGKPYYYGGTSSSTSWDCSGFMGAFYAIFTGKNPNGPRYFNTESDFEALGFKPGFQPGAFNIGIMRGGGGPNSHMGGTLPNGVAVESSGSNGVQYGGKAKGANTFPLKYYLPVGGDPRTGQFRMPAYGGGGGGGGGRMGGLAGVAGGGIGGGGGGGGGGVPIMPGPGGTWTSPNAAWAALIQRESGGRADIIQQIVDANTGGNEASGLFQIAKGTWAGAGGGAFAATAGEASPAQQAEIAARIFRAQGGGPWGAGLPGRENAAELGAGLDETSGYLGDFGDELGNKTTDLGAFDTSLGTTTANMSGLADATQGAGGGPGAAANSPVQMIGELADIAKGGLTETFLPPGFSDPSEWPVMKSIGGLFNFFSGTTQDPTAKGILGAFGAGFSGSPSGAVSALAGITGPRGYGQLEPGGPKLAPDDFSAMGQAVGGSVAANLVDAAGGMLPAAQPQNVDNSIHIGENGVVGQDPAAVRDQQNRQRDMQVRSNMGGSMARAAP